MRRYSSSKVGRVDTKRRLLRVSVHCWVPHARDLRARERGGHAAEAVQDPAAICLDNAKRYALGVVRLEGEDLPPSGVARAVGARKACLLLSRFTAASHNAAPRAHRLS